MPLIKVVVHGALGRMGKDVLNALGREPDMEPVGVVDLLASEDYLSLPDGSGLIPLSKELGPIITRCRPQAVVDFTNARAAMDVIRTATAMKVSAVIGSTGLSQADLEEADSLCRTHQIGVFVAPNFALGAVLLIHLARQIGRFFDYADITEIHHETKIDAPSGTALAIARALVDGKGGPFKAPKPERESLPGTRGGEYEGVIIHSGRMPGKMAYHSLVLGTRGQTLSIQHDTVSRECYMPGVIMAVREVVKSKGLVVGLDKVMGL